MKQQGTYTDPISFDITVEEFDALDEVHAFSRKYKKKKKKMLKAYRKSHSALAKRTYARAAAAVCCCVIGIPIMANAAANGAFFDRIWGNLTKENIKSHKEQIYDEQENPLIHTFPEREYVPADPDRAQELIGDYVSNQPITKQLGDTTLTILSCVSDGNAAIMEFSLERADGVNAFHYSQLDNEYQGATFSHDVAFRFHFPACAEHIYVDLERSSKTKLYCYNYMTMDPDAYDRETKGILLEICEYPCTMGELFAADEDAFAEYMDKTVTSSLIVPLPGIVPLSVYANPDGGTAEISPLAMKVDMDTGLGLEEQNEILYDTNNIYYASVNYTDGTRYVITEHSLQGQHDCEVETDNSSSIACDSQGNLFLVFNRLVDTDQIADLTVNNITYTLQNNSQGGKQK